MSQQLTEAIKPGQHQDICSLITQLTVSVISNNKPELVEQDPVSKELVVTYCDEPLMVMVNVDKEGNVTFRLANLMTDSGEFYALNSSAQVEWESLNGLSILDSVKDEERFQEALGLFRRYLK